MCESGSFEIAASMPHITQSALSQRIGALERESGRVLLQRSRPVEPTAPGRILLGLARQGALLHPDAEHLMAALLDSDGACSHKGGSPKTSRPAGWSDSIRVTVCACRSTGSGGGSTRPPLMR